MLQVQANLLRLKQAAEGFQAKPFVIQVVQRMTEHGSTNNPVQLLHDVCNEVQAQAPPRSGNYPPAAEGYNRAPQDAFVSRGMTPAPEDSFAEAASSMPQPQFLNALMFRGVPQAALRICNAGLRGKCLATPFSSSFARVVIEPVIAPRATTLELSQRPAVSSRDTVCEFALHMLVCCWTVSAEP